MSLRERLYSLLPPSPSILLFTSGHHHLSPSEIDALHALVEKDDQAVVAEYETAMAQRIGEGAGVSFAAARMGFYVLLKLLNIGPGDEVLLPGFTCGVMPNAILRRGAKPIYVDIEKSTLGPNPASIKEHITPRTKLIVAQHSFGIPCSVEEIAGICQKRGIFLLEDSALAFGSKLKGRVVGNFGDAALFSTDHSKPLNTLVGGFLYTRNKALYKKISEEAKHLPSLRVDHRKRLFSQFLIERRYFSTPSPASPAYYISHALGVKVRNVWSRLRKRCSPSVFFDDDTVLEPEYARYPYPARFPAFLAALGLSELKRWDEASSKRKRLLAALLKQATELGMSNFLPAAYTDSEREIIPLRFILLKKNALAIREAMSKNLFTYNTWFTETVVNVPGGPQEVGYLSGSCPVAEEVCHEIVNIPCVLSEEFDERVIALLQNV